MTDRPAEMKTLPKIMGYENAAPLVWRHLKALAANGTTFSRDTASGRKPGRLWVGTIAAAIYDLWPHISPADQRRAAAEVRSWACRSLVITEAGAGQKPSTIWVADEWEDAPAIERRAPRGKRKAKITIQPADQLALPAPPTEVVPPTPETPDNVLEVKLDGGAGVVFIGLKVDFFTMDDRAAELVEDIRRAVRNYNDPNRWAVRVEDRDVIA